MNYRKEHERYTSLSEAVEAARAEILELQTGLRNCASQSNSRQEIGDRLVEILKAYHAQLLAQSVRQTFGHLAADVIHLPEPEERKAAA